MTTTVTKRIGSYDRETHDFPAFVIHEDGHEEYIGSRPTQHDASLLASDYIIQFYSDAHTPEKAAQLIHEELAQEGRHAQAARDMGGVWEISGDWVTLEQSTCGGSTCPCCDPSHPEAPERGWEREEAEIDIPSVLEMSDTTLETECAICYSLQPCYDDGGGMDLHRSCGVQPAAGGEQDAPLPHAERTDQSARQIPARYSRRLPDHRRSPRGARDVPG